MGGRRHGPPHSPTLSRPEKIWPTGWFELSRVRRKDFASKNKEGDIIEGEIKNITDFGIFVGLTSELDGLIHASDIAWDDSGEKEIKKYSIDQKIKFKILDIDVEKERISCV